MNMSIQNNLAAMNANRMYNITGNKRAKSAEKLSSGYRINRAADDAAGLAISEKMRRQIKGLNQASRNIQDGISFDQSADGYLDEIHSILQRINELAVQSANGTNEETDRSYLDQEVQALKKETKKIFREADFNEIKIWEIPYAPDPSLIPGMEPDIQVFNDGMNPDGTPKWGGVEINHVRHTWEELGVQFNEDGTFAGTSMYLEDGTLDKVVEQVIEFPTHESGSPDYTGERVVLKMKPGEKPPVIARNYKWEANEEGICVNNAEPTIPWSEVKDEGGNPISEPVKYEEYSFTFRNMNIAFTPAKGDTTMDDVIKGISGDTLPTFYTFDLEVNAEEPVEDIRQAVHTSGKRQYVNNANQHIIDNDYVVRANEYRVTLEEEDGKAHSVMMWGHTEKDFNAVDAEGKSFPITDWGTSYVEMTNHDPFDDMYNRYDSRMITFDDGLDYVYKDTVGNDQYKLPVEFSFNLQDETSIDAAIAALDGATFTKEFDAPGRVYSNGATIVDGSDRLTQDFYLQRDYGRNFDKADAKLEGTVQRTVTNVKQSSTGEIEIPGTYSSRNTSSGTPKEVYAQTDDGRYYKLNEYHSGKNESWLTADKLTKEIKCEYSGTFAGYQIDKVAGEGTVSRTNIYTKTRITDNKTYRFADGSLDPVIVDSVPANAAIVTDFDINKIGQPVTSVTNDSHYSGSKYENDEDEVRINTAKGEAMTVVFSNGYDDPATKQATVGWQATGPASRDFKLSPNYNELKNPVYNASAKANFEYFHLNLPERDLWIQSGVEAGSGIMERWEPLNNASIGISSTNVLTQRDAGRAIGQVKRAMDKISEQRSQFGAYQNRLEHSYNIDQNTAENTQYGESQIRDTDMAAEMVEYSNHGILEQAGASMLTQANQSRQNVLSLLQ